MNFILQQGIFNRENNKDVSAPIFYKEFFVKGISTAFLNICSPNIAVCYINGKNITKDIFVSPASVLDKTLYVKRYRVDKFLKEGRNVIAVILGNGLRNEGVESVWGLNKEPDRGFPEFALELYFNDKFILESDESWKTHASPIIYNQFRIGEYFDLRVQPIFSESDDFAVVDKNPPKWKLRLCDFHSVRECETLKPQKIVKISEEKYLVDFGKNISGYVELKAVIPDGKEVKLIYAERVFENGEPDFGEMPKHFSGSEFSTDKIIGNGKGIVFKPIFSYHGFRYVVVDGVNCLTAKNIRAFFIHQNIKRALYFKSSDKMLEKLFDMSVNALLSNSVHLLTDCPTREKFGWTNDAMCSAESLMYIFDCKSFAVKLLRDYVDSVDESGRTVSLIPVCEWSKNNCHGIFNASALFEFAEKIYEIYGDEKGYRISYDTCRKVIDRFLSEKQENGLFIQHYGLGDWAGPYKDYLHPPAPLQFTDSALMYKCLKQICKAAEILKKYDDAARYKKEAEELKLNIKKEYLKNDGSSEICEMSVLSLLIAFGLYDDIEPLKIQLKAEVEKHDYHHYCGMISLRYLYEALDKCDLSEYAYKIITARGFPSYSKWIEDGDTSLCETWDNHSSHNHHMYSSFTMWIIKSLCGFSLDKKTIKTVKPLDCVESFALTYKKRGKAYSVIKNDKEVRYEDN